MLSSVSVGTSNQVSWGSGVSYQHQAGWWHPIVALGMRVGLSPWVPLSAYTSYLVS